MDKLMMKVLLDTHILLWLLQEPQQLSPSTLSLLEDRNVEVYYSVATLWELAVKASIGKIEIDFEVLLEALKQNSILPLAINIPHILLMKDLPLHHKDPFDRIIVAQAMVEGFQLFTRDAVLKQYAPRVVKLI